MPEPCGTVALDYRGRTVGIDACIAPALEALWKREIETEGCCCGHGRERPSVVLGRTEDAEAARSVLKVVDDREWTLLQWQLVEV